MSHKSIALLVGVSLFALPGIAYAQDAVPAEDVATSTDQSTSVDDAGAPAEEIVVTGSRIARSGAQEQTPVTMVAVEDLQKAAPTNIPDALNQLPQFQGSRSTTGGSGNNVLSNANQPRAGNYLNLRNVGSQRMLVLLNGRRVPPTSFEGIVDTNTIPQGLVQRVDVVTAGASAVYGADAVSGVVNFILDTKFQGVRGSLQSGVTELGDGFNWRGSLAGGTSFAGGRGHIVASYDHFDSDGVGSKADRPYLYEPLYFLAGRGTSADPFRTVTNTRNIGYTPGGLITGASNAAAQARLLNLQFLDSQTTRALVIGAPTQQANVRIGGEGAVGIPETVLAAKLRTDQAFTHVRYDLSDTVTAFVQGSYSKAYNQYDTNFDSRTGAQGFTIFRENPYIPTAIRQVLTDTNAASFTLSRQLKDFPVNRTETDTRSWTTTAGFEGKVSFLENGRWDAYYTHGDSRLNTRQVQNENRNLFAAVDAVDEGLFRTGTANGNIVCRVTITNPSLVPGCVPVNLFGNGTPSAAAVDFIAGYTEFEVTNKLDEFGANFSGSPFSTGAGPVGFNVGVTYRRQSLLETSNSDPSIRVDYTGGSDPRTPATYTGIRGVPGLTAALPTPPARFNFTNVGTAKGSTETKEVYGEFVLPLLRDVPLFNYFELNGALRYTDYSTSGGIETWKIGGIWEPIDGVRFRATYSKDIREPTLYDLFAGTQINPSFYDDQGFTNQNLATLFVSGGNPDLKPEQGRTLAFGAVLTPRFLPGFSASVDYYRLKIEDAIGTIGPNVIRDQCRASGGTDPLCALIVRPGPITDTSPANFPTEVRQYPINIAYLETEGVDIDISYRLPLSKLSNGLTGTLSLRGISNYTPRYETNAGAGSATFDLAGTVGRSKWRHTITASYDDGGLGLFLQARIIGAAQRDTAKNTNQVYVENTVAAETYLDFTIDYDITVGSRRMTPFFTVNNLLDNRAPIVAISFIPGVLIPTESGTYDILGRRFTAGVRFNF
ncbi:TonB-dependent receptor [Sphingomonas sp. HF-S3]|uniref:TonB-dependent receptor n=1 Tax=Sphingomonas rustica TaxID=3103142 RepID=A0ABV0BAJ2_9SPHN